MMADSKNLQPSYDAGETMTADDPEFTPEEWGRVLDKLGECETEEDELLYKKADAIRISEMKRRFRKAAAEVGLKDRYILDEGDGPHADIGNTIEEAETKEEPQENCGRCKFFKSFPYDECHRNPPLTQISSGRFKTRNDSIRPRVKLSEWCGEFKRRDV